MVDETLVGVDERTMHRNAEPCRNAPRTRNLRRGGPALIVVFSTLSLACTGSSCSPREYEVGRGRGEQDSLTGFVLSTSWVEEGVDGVFGNDGVGLAI